MRSNCQNVYLCHLMKGFNYDSINNMPHFISPVSSLGYRRQTLKTTAMQPRSYYGYGTNAAPAYYPTFDPISILASLAFLAFLLQSFVSLFDRSRSIIPAVVSSRDSTLQHQIPDPIQLIMRAIDEYATFNHSIKLLDETNSRKKLS
ncbi:uncharacterized protein [Chelonus insularis]|uniref:uncharacterized protein n=1 Tax=Chelonus insularis TaxID=460826 RepID=UPI00158D5A51|nr:uncharacterized protein LOC118068316 [Chelonus insularis]